MRLWVYTDKCSCEIFVDMWMFDISGYAMVVFGYKWLYVDIGVVLCMLLKIYVDTWLV